MRVCVYPLPNLVPRDLTGPAVVIDVLRATSVMVTALANGAHSIRTVAEVESARSLADSYPPGTVLLGGERRALPIPGFDFGNSPLEYTKNTVQGKTIILTTTNGTRALETLKGVRPLFIGAFLNGSAVAKALASLGQDATLVCSGTRGHFSLDDAACAGMVSARLQELVPGLELDDMAYTVLSLYQQHQKNLRELIHHAAHCQYLTSIGLEKDITYCLQEDLFALVPQLVNEEVKI
ncbi:MAG: 2-phosphosulfolactate phosphatase [Firmicutes bacterium]|nr:2-phosphosulfolactate phosphatase [Bacillota bacterium]